MKKLLVIFFSVLVLSCSDDNENLPPTKGRGPMLTFSLNSKLNEDVWVILSDHSGNVFNVQKMDGRHRLDFYYPHDRVLGETFQMTYVRRMIATHDFLTTVVSITTILDMKPGEFTESDPNNFISTGYYTVNFPDPKSYEHIKYTFAGNSYFKVSVPSISFYVNSSAPSSHFLVWLKKPNQEASYFFDSDAKTGESVLINDEFTTNQTKPLNSILLKKPELTFTSYTLYTHVKDGRDALIKIPVESGNAFGDEIKLFYPLEKGVFKNHNAVLNYASVINGYQSYTVESIPFSNPSKINFGVYDPILESCKLGGGQYKMKTTEPIGAFTFSGSTLFENRIFINWTVSGSESGREVEGNFPMLPSQILTNYDIPLFNGQVHFGKMELTDGVSSRAFMIPH